MSQPLAVLFEESVDQVRQRELTAIDNLLTQRQGRVVIFGAGTLGRRALTLLRELGCHVLAFSDNYSGNWGCEIEDIPIISPERAASLYGKSALFLVTIWNDRHWYSETHTQLSSLGCTLISTYVPLFWKFPDRFLQLFFLNEPAHKLYLKAQEVLEAEKIWADQASLHVYRANIRWRALGDALELPGRPDINTYAPSDLFRLNEEDRVLDCGAFDGDTVRDLLAISNAGLASIDAIEADSLSFGRLEHFVSNLPQEMRHRIRAHHCAVGAERASVRFEVSGSVISKYSDIGSLVEQIPIDELFADKALTFIKMDIEGAEFDAIRGASTVIHRDRPILAICVYHTQDHIFRIPLLVHEIVPEHKLYLRAYEGDGFQTVMYAIPPERLAQGAEVRTE